MEVIDLGPEFSPGSGRSYPFVDGEPNGVAAVEDLFVSTDAQPDPVLRLFSVWTPRTTGVDPGVRPGAHEYDLELYNSAGALFDTRDFSIVRKSTWGTSREVVTWIEGSTVITAVFNTVNEYPGAFFLERGYLDPRVVSWRRPAIRDVLVYKNGGYVSARRSDNRVVFREGHNCDLSVTTETAVTGELTSVIQFDFEPGAGLGLHPGCDVELGITSIGGATPDAAGNVNLSGTDGCFAFEPKIDFISNDVGVLNRGKFVLRDDCDVPCECEDFQAVYRYLRRTWSRYLALGRRAEAVRDRYHELREVLQEILACAEKKSLRALLWPVRDCQFAGLVGLCNPTDSALHDVELEFTLTTDSGQLSDEADGPICDTINRRDFEEGNRMPEPYYFEQGLPVAKVRLRCVPPKSLAYVTFKVNYQGQDKEEVEIRLRAVTVPEPLPPQDEVTHKIKLVCPPKENCTEDTGASS
ncbi:MAG: hypothetical protein KatS3mg109_0011 [Pirellulaceae bacterium]|nr:MAG: hypothetical protein KatS3mg109_0011 [Pirellulaceae bacterium]